MLEVSAAGNRYSPQPHWLTSEERNWYAFAYALIRLPAALDAQMHRDAGISQFEYLVLSGLSMAPARTRRMSELAEFSASSPSRLSNVVTKLQANGWVQRTTDPTDGRYTLATLTDDGWAKVCTSAPAHVQEVRRLVFDPLTTTQHRQLGQVAERILAAIDLRRPRMEESPL